MWRNLPLVFFLLLGCAKIERYGRGKINEIVIVFDGAKRDALFLRDSLEETYYTPHEERLFKVIPVKAEQFSAYAGYKNVLILATTSSDNFGFFKEVFGNTKPGMYTTKNVFMEGDFVVGVVAEEEIALWTFIHNRLPEIKGLFMKRLKKFLKKKAYFAGHDNKFSKEIEKKYGFSLDLPNGWAYIVEDTNFLALGKHYPDRFIFVYRNRFKEPLKPEVIMDLRDSLTKKYYKGDKILRQFVKVKRDSFLGVECLKIYGPWQNDSMIIGGPFVTWAFNLDDSFYMLDGGVFAPDKTEKLEYIFREELVLESFRPR